MNAKDRARFEDIKIGINARPHHAIYWIVETLDKAFVEIERLREEVDRLLKALELHTKAEQGSEK